MTTPSIDHADLVTRAQRLAQTALYEAMVDAIEASELIRTVRPNKRRAWLSHVIDELYAKQHGNCALCGEPLGRESPHVDHIIPFVYGGGNERRNLQLAHPRCNQRKRAQVDLPALVAYLEDLASNLP